MSKVWNITKTENGQRMERIRDGAVVELDADMGIKILPPPSAIHGTTRITWDDAQDMFRGIIRTKRIEAGKR